MHTIKIEFKLKKTSDFEQLNDSVNILLGAWRMNGQVLGKQFPFAHTENSLQIYVNTPDLDSLSKEYNNKYVKDALSKIGELEIIPKIDVLGIEPESAMLCDCPNVKSYILFTTYVSLASPLKCFKCFGVVPLYKIPKTYDEEYYNIICWQSDYQSCDSLQMNCTVGERFATDQLSKYDSQLTKQGLKVCESIEKVTGKETFYYLYKYRARSLQIELSRKCPNCGKDWKLKKPLHDLFDFKCKKCKLLSNIAWDVR